MVEIGYVIPLKGIKLMLFLAPRHNKTCYFSVGRYEEPEARTNRKLPKVFKRKVGKNN